MKTRKNKILVIFVAVLSVLIGQSCTEYLDIVPDNTPTVNHAFQKRYHAEASLYGLYSFLPYHSLPARNPAFLAGEEAWCIDLFNFFDHQIWKIAKGEQGTQEPIGNYWGSQGSSYSLNGGSPVFTGINDCNIFIDNIHITIDLDESERDRWISEAKVIKAYLHFWLLNMYGPIPLIKESVDVSVTGDESQPYREPVDSVFNYIIELIDEAAPNLPLKIDNEAEELGRITLPVALALKAKILTYAASPLFNGNPDYADFIDGRGVNLFPTVYDPLKWEKAAEALREAIDVCHEAGHKLFDFSLLPESHGLNEMTILTMQVRGAMTERWNSEIIWGDSRDNLNQLQRFGHPFFVHWHTNGPAMNSWAPPLNVVKQFYTDNGVPIEEDKDWEGIDIYGLRTAADSDKYVLEPKYETINLHFNREARFYGSLHIDGGKYYGQANALDNNMLTSKFKYLSHGVSFYNFKYPSTGYLVKKALSRYSNFSMTSGSYTIYRYAFTVIRLADIYLLYSEVLNEVKNAPDGEVYEYIDLVRARTGLDGVVESWANYSNIPDKPLTKEGMREIIRRERLNELAFEGQRLWDLRRWKLLKEYMNRPIQGWDVFEKESEGFYKVQTLFEPVFEDKDYLWPLRQGNLLKNRNLVQNPGW
jgi:hypothetical protein